MDVKVQKKINNKRPTIPFFGIILLIIIIGFSLTIILMPQWSKIEVSFIL